jgi:hypothetical protein
MAWTSGYTAACLIGYASVTLRSLSMAMTPLDPARSLRNALYNVYSAAFIHWRS